MPKIEIPEERILESLDELSPRARREALRRLLPRAAYLERAIERNGPRIEALARSRGLDWAALNDDQREQLIDELLHEKDQPCVPCWTRMCFFLDYSGEAPPMNVFWRPRRASMSLWPNDGELSRSGVFGNPRKMVEWDAWTLNFKADRLAL